MSKYGVLACPGCATQVAKTSPNMKRCKPCALAAHGQTGRGYAERACTICGATYKPTGSHQKVCEPCAPEFRNRRNAEHLRELRARRGAIAIGTILQCAECGDDFPYSSGPQRRCTECQRKHEVGRIHEALKRSPKFDEYKRRARDNYHFDGNRAKALERDDYTCQRCGSQEDLHVHHKDGNGVTSPRESRNNTIDNLLTLCRGCHTRVHVEERRHHATSAARAASD